MLRVDAGSVECSEDFVLQCAHIHGLGKPANDGMQQQNPVDRYEQTAQNMMAAMMMAQDLLPASFYGWTVISAWKTLNCISNHLVLKLIFSCLKMARLLMHLKCFIMRSGKLWLALVWLRRGME